LIKLVDEYENTCKRIKDECFTIAWYMRGGVQADDLLWKYTSEDREILNKIIKENIEATNKTGLPLV